MLFAKNRLTKKVSFEGGWVELQHLSKGTKDSIKARLAELYAEMKDLDEDALKKIGDGNLDAAPSETIKTLVKEIQSLQYFKLSQAIKNWSETETPISIETVMELDESVFDKLLTEVDEMNELSGFERKN